MWRVAKFSIVGGDGMRRNAVCAGLVRRCSRRRPGERSDRQPVTRTFRRWGAVPAGLVLAVAAMVGGGLGGPSASAQSAPVASITAFGDAVGYGAPAGGGLNAPLAGMASTPDGKGYWLLGADGGVFTYGDAGFYGSQATGVYSPLVGIARTPDGHGYWIAGNSGVVYNFGDASSGGASSGGYYAGAAPVVGITATPKAMGYWLAAADGGVFSFGSAGFYGSMGGKALNAPVVGMASTPGGHGYWLVAADGGVFSFGSAGFYGSMGGKALNAPVVGIASTPGGHGYWLVAADGGVFSFGSARFYGSTGSNPPASSTPVVAMASSASGGGYWLATTGKALPPATPVPSVLPSCNLPGTPPSVRPSEIILNCGDGYRFLSHLVWSSWTASTATATGVYTYNTCHPSCAAGTFVSRSASVRLDYPVRTGAGVEFGGISFTYPSPSAPGGYYTETRPAPTSRG